jgi:hypothetical protein
MFGAQAMSKFQWTLLPASDNKRHLKTNGVVKRGSNFREMLGIRSGMAVA